MVTRIQQFPLGGGAPADGFEPRHIDVIEQFTPDPPTNVDTTTVETALRTFALGAGVLAIGDQLRLRAFGAFFQNTGVARTYDIRWRVGTGALPPIAQEFDGFSPLPDGVLSRGWDLETIMSRNGATATHFYSTFRMYDVGSFTLADTTVVNFVGHRNAFNFDFDLAGNIVLTTQHEFSSGSQGTQLKGLIIEHIKG